MTSENLQPPSPTELMPVSDLIRKALEQLDRVLLGRPELHQLVLAGVIARGHLLLEGLPGLGKTALIKALGEILRLDFKRIQFTPDLMPSDILGTHILQEGDGGKRELVLKKGPVFTNILLADEINRASPKTQSAMLETMQERSVTLFGTTMPLPSPFFVLASQNPIELEGTYPLPEAQLDRFLFKLAVGNIDASVLESIITSRRRGEPPSVTWRMTGDELQTIFAMVDRILLPRAVAGYVARLVTASHPTSANSPTRVKDYVQYGASPRAAIGMAEAARARALMQGRPTVGFEDVKFVAPHVLNHRILLTYKARFDKVDSPMVIDDILESVKESGMDLPADVQVGAASR